MSTEPDPGTSDAASSDQPTGAAGGPLGPSAWMQPDPHDPALDTRTESTSAPSAASAAQTASAAAESPDQIESDTVYVARPNPFTGKPRRSQPSGGPEGGPAGRSWPILPAGRAPVQDPYSSLRPSGEPGPAPVAPSPSQPAHPQSSQTAPSRPSEADVQTVLQPPQPHQAQPNQPASAATPPAQARASSSRGRRRPGRPHPPRSTQAHPGLTTRSQPRRRSFDQPPGPPPQTGPPPPPPPGGYAVGPPPGGYAGGPPPGGYAGGPPPGGSPYPGGPPHPQPGRTASLPLSRGRTASLPAQPTTQPVAPTPPPPAQPRSYSAGELINQLNPQTDHKSRKGLRSRLGLKPSTRELSEIADEDMARTAFTRPVTIMIANPKGGVGKTPTALLLAAAFGTARGGGVIAWDNNELRGTMPDRSFSPHRKTVRDLLDAQSLLSAPQSQFTDLAQFLNHQTAGKFHTLGSAQTSGHVISSDDFEYIHDILSRYFQIILVDTGNNEASPNWLAAAAAADCLVVPTKWRKDSLIPAARMLETLQEFSRDLLDRTVVVATNGPADSQEEVKRNGASWFDATHSIIEIPTDPHVAEGGIIDWSKLGPRTRRSALSLAAQVAARIKPLAG